MSIAGDAPAATFMQEQFCCLPIKVTSSSGNLRVLPRGSSNRRRLSEYEPPLPAQIKTDYRKGLIGTHEGDARPFIVPKRERQRAISHEQVRTNRLSGQHGMSVCASQRLRTTCKAIFWRRFGYHDSGVCGPFDCYIAFCRLAFFHPRNYSKTILLAGSDFDPPHRGFNTVFKVNLAKRPSRRSVI